MIEKKQKKIERTFFIGQPSISMTDIWRSKEERGARMVDDFKY